MGLFLDFLTLIYPKTCFSCEGQLLEGEEIMCLHCWNDLVRKNASEDDPILKNKIGVALNYTSCYALLNYKKHSKVKKLIKHLKYNNRPEIGVYLGRYFGKKLKYSALQIDAIIPVPMHYTKLKKRGYNQSEAFANGLSDELGIPVVNALTKTVPRDSQTKRGRLKRWENVKDIFAVNELIKKEWKCVLLVDDVVTTGATLEACAVKIQEYGIEEICLCVIAEAKT